MVYLIGLLFVIANAFAQPVEGPWTLYECPDLTSFQIVARDDMTTT